MITMTFESFKSAIGNSVTTITNDGATEGVTLSEDGLTANVYNVAVTGSSLQSSQMPTSLINVDLSGLDVSGMTGMAYMFNYCKNLTNLDLSSWDVSNVTDMSYMFEGAWTSESDVTPLYTLNVTGWNTSNVTTMAFMFAQPTAYYGAEWEYSYLKEIIGYEDFNTSNVTDMEYMFAYKYKFTSLDLHKWNVNKVENFTSIFDMTGEDLTSSMEELNLSDWSPLTTAYNNNIFGSIDGAKILITESWTLSRSVTAYGGSNLRFLKDETTVNLGEVELATTNTLTEYKKIHTVYSQIDRWLRFDFTDSNHKSVTIKAGTVIIFNASILRWLTDTSYDLSTYLTEVGTDYYIYTNSAKQLIASKESSVTGYLCIGRCTTVCADVGSITMIAPASPSSGLSTGDKYLVKSYRQEEDADFYSFYEKDITAVSSGSYYDVITCTHPLSGFVAGDILPESVFCLTFKPSSLYDDSMVYDKNTDIMVDVYLQSGTGFNTRSHYGSVHTVSRPYWNHAADFNTVGKKLLKDAEFTSIALGSNERTNITGSSDKSTVGGHVDTNNRRMISAIGVEEACGYIWQWIDEVGSSNTDGWHTEDGQASFGQDYYNPYQLRAGGLWSDGSLCGSRCRSASNVRSYVYSSIGSRGSSRVIRGTI